MKKIILSLLISSLCVWGDYFKLGVSASSPTALPLAQLIGEKIKEGNPKSFVGLFQNRSLFTQNSTLVALKMAWIDMALLDEKGLERIVGGKKSLSQSLESLGFKGCGPYGDGSYFIISKKKWSTLPTTTQLSLQNLEPLSPPKDIQQHAPLQETQPLPTPEDTVKEDVKKPYKPQLLQES